MGRLNEDVREDVAQTVAAALREHDDVLLSVVTGEQVGPLGGSSNRVLVAYRTKQGIIGGVVNVYFDGSTHQRLVDSMEYLDEQASLEKQVKRLAKKLS